MVTYRLQAVPIVVVAYVRHVFIKINPSKNKLSPMEFNLGDFYGKLINGYCSGFNVFWVLILH